MDWKEYESIVIDECERVYGRSHVRRNVFIKGVFSGTKRQIDILVDDIERAPGDKIVYEVKYYARKINIKIVEAFISMLKDVGIEKGVMVSEKGFSKAAIRRAHVGEESIEVDILSLGEWQQSHSPLAIPYAGENALIVSSPFGWIVDCDGRGFSLATLYQRGVTFEYAVEKLREWMYLSFWRKDADAKTIKDLLGLQKEKSLPEDAFVQVYEDGDVTVRKVFVSWYPTPEVTVFRDFGEYIGFAVLFCPEPVLARDLKKAILVMRRAIPACIRDETKGREGNESQQVIKVSIESHQ